MAHAKYDPTLRVFVLDDGSVLENLRVTSHERHVDSFPVYEYGSSSAVAQVSGQVRNMITIEYEEPETYSLEQDIQGWKSEVDKEEIRKKSKEIIDDFRR